MIQFLVTAVIVVVFAFLLVIVLALMIFVISKLLRFLFPQRYGAAVKAVQEKKKVKGKSNLEQRCPECELFGKCPAAMTMKAPCRSFKKASAEEVS